jgi:hypothetical protein
MNIRKIGFLIVIVIALLAGYLYSINSDETGIADRIGNAVENRNPAFANFKTNFDKASVDLDLLLSGGPGKDGIPALTDPKFVLAKEANIEDDVQGILVEFDADMRFYPFNILVWHEIVNDSIGDNHFAVTFCPLCASAILFDRNVSGEVLEFGVSGFLFESNLIMYDRKTESFWSQSKAEAIVGDFLGTKLDVLWMQQLNFSEVKEKYPNIKVLSDDTGYSRDYLRNPYSGYEETEETVFPVSVSDKRFGAKEMMYVVPFMDKSVAFPPDDLVKGRKETLNVEGSVLTAQRQNGGIVVSASGKRLPGYFEMWFSWATHHQDDGIVWEMG